MTQDGVITILILVLTVIFWRRVCYWERRAKHWQELAEERLRRVAELHEFIGALREGSRKDD